MQKIESEFIPLYEHRDFSCVGLVWVDVTAVVEFCTATGTARTRADREYFFHPGTDPRESKRTIGPSGA